MKEILRKYRNFGKPARKKKQDLNEIFKEIKNNSQKTRPNQDILRRDQDWVVTLYTSDKCPVDKETNWLVFIRSQLIGFHYDRNLRLYHYKNRILSIYIFIQFSGFTGLKLWFTWNKLQHEIPCSQVSRNVLRLFRLFSFA